LHLFFITFAATASAASFHYETISVPGSQPTTTFVNGINDQGQLVGSFTDVSGVMRGFLLSPDHQTYTVIIAPGSTYTTAIGINNNGEVIGLAYYLTRPTVYIRSADGAAYTTFDIPQATGGMVYDLSLNNKRQITGFARTNGQFQSFYCTDSGASCVSFAIPGADTTWARSINDSGQIVGSAAYGAAVRGFVADTSGRYTLFDVPAATLSTAPTGISTNGQIAGYYVGVTGQHNFVRSADGSAYDSFDDPSVAPGNSYAMGVNSSGTVAGYSTPSFDKYQGFMAIRTMSGDLNGDGVVDCKDIAIVSASFGKRTGDPGFDARADVNNDGIVDIRDLSIVSQQLPAGTLCQ
jgi:hypothetical protein